MQQERGAVDGVVTGMIQSGCWSKNIAAEIALLNCIRIACVMLWNIHLLPAADLKNMDHIGMMQSRGIQKQTWAMSAILSVNTVHRLFTTISSIHRTGKQKP